MKHGIHTHGNQKPHIYAFNVFPPFFINVKNTGFVWFVQYETVNQCSISNKIINRKIIWLKEVSMSRYQILSQISSKIRTHFIIYRITGS